MRTMLALCAVLLASPALAAFTFPEGGLPEGRLAIQPVVSARQAAVGTASLFQNFLRTSGASLPGAGAISSLDPAAARYAAGAMVGRVPAELWAEVFAGKDLDAAERGRIVAAFKPYMEQAAAAAARDNAGIAAKIQREIDGGRLGAQDLEDAYAALRGLCAHDPSLKGTVDELATAVETLKSRKLSRGIADGAATWEGRKAESLGEVAGTEGEGAPRLSPSSPEASNAKSIPAPKPAAPSKAKTIFKWAAPIVAMMTAVVGIDWGTKAFALHHIFTAFHEAAWRAPLMGFIVPFIFLTAYKARGSLASPHFSWRWSPKQIRNGKLGWYKASLAGTDEMKKDHPSLKWLVRLYDASIALMLGGMLGNGIDLLRLGGALDWIPLGRSLMNFADVALLAGLSFFQIATHFFVKASEAYKEKRSLNFNTASFLGLPLVGFFIAWAFGTIGTEGPLTLGLKNIGFLYLMGFSMLIGIFRFGATLVINRFAKKFVDEQDAAKKA